MAFVNVFRGLRHLSAVHSLHRLQVLILGVARGFVILGLRSPKPRQVPVEIVERVAELRTI